MWENVLMSWYKPYKLRMVPCLRALLCRTCTPSWGKAVEKQLWWYGIIQHTCKPSRRKPQWPGAVAALPVSEPPKGELLKEGADESHDSHTPRLTVRQRHENLFHELDLSSLDSWTLELVEAAHWLLAKYHDVFLLDPAELGCIHSMEHIIKVTNDTPLKNGLDKFHCHWLRRLGIT